MDVSIILVNYNTKNLTEACIKSIIEKTNNITYEIILIDNASNDGSKEVFENNPNIKYIYLEKNIGFGMANNIGVEESSGDKILFLNTDTILINNAIKILSDYLKLNPKVAVCGGNLLDAENAPSNSYRLYFPGIYAIINGFARNIPDKLLYGPNTFYNNSKIPRAVAYICGADLMIRRSVINQVGGFSPDFFMYYEETDLCYRVKKAGYKIMSVPEAKIIHFVGKSFGEGPSKYNYQRICMMYSSKKIFLKKHHGSVYYGINMFLNYMHLFLNLIIRKDKTHYKKLIKILHES